MARKFYLPNRDADKVAWLENFAQKAAHYQAVLGLSNETIEQLETDFDVFEGTLVVLEQLRNTVEAYTAFKNQLRNGSGLLVLPQLPVWNPIAPNVKSDIFGRVRNLVKTIKGNPNYTESIGDDMRIIGEESASLPDTWKPVLGVELKVGKPNILWKKGESSGIKLWVDRGSGFEFLAIDTSPDYQDNHPLPPLGQSAIWKYQAIYLLKDGQVGQISDVLEVTVTGQNT